MRRITWIAPLVVMFAAGWVLGTSQSGQVQSAEARPKPTCKDDLAKARRELTAARAEAAANGERAAALELELDKLLGRERKRVQTLEDEIGSPIKELK